MISIGKTTILLSCLTPQISPNGRPYKQIGVRINEDMPTVWVGKDKRNHWIYTFRYLDEVGGYFEIEIDEYNKFFKLWN